MNVAPASRFVGIQIGPISFVDEGVEPVLDTLRGRVGVDTLLIVTVSWLGLKVGRRISHALEGFPDHGVASPQALRGGAYIRTRPRYYARTRLRGFAARNDIFGVRRAKLIGDSDRTVAHRVASCRILPHANDACGLVSRFGHARPPH